jgi:hypothetical protein
VGDGKAQETYAYVAFHTEQEQVYRVDAYDRSADTGRHRRELRRRRRRKGRRRRRRRRRRRSALPPARPLGVYVVVVVVEW